MAKRTQDTGVIDANRPQKKRQQIIYEKVKNDGNGIENSVSAEENAVGEVVEKGASGDETAGKNGEVEQGGDIEGDNVEERDENQSDGNQVSSSSLFVESVPHDDGDDETVHGDGGGSGDTDADDEDLIESLLEPFGREQLLTVLKEAADKHVDVADRIREIADLDPVHRKIFVHGLGWDTTAETLVNAFKFYGEIEDCKAVFDKLSGKSKGYGFILFKKRSGARRALKEPQKKIGNRMTACQLASIGPAPSQGIGQPAITLQHTAENTQRKIYVSNVGADLDPQKLTSFFSKFGEIEEGPLGLDKVTKKPKGFCLFVYKTVESAKKALEEPYKNFEGHVLHCQKAIDGPKPVKNAKPLRTLHGGMQNTQFPQHGVGATSGPGHLLVPPRPTVGFNPAPAPNFNPAIGQALTALLGAPTAGLGLTNFLGNLGSIAAANQAGVPVANSVVNAYGSLSNMNPAIVGPYGPQVGIQTSYQSQPPSQGGSGRGQHGLSQFGGSGSYMGH